MPATRKVWFATACRSASPFVINFNWGATCARQREIGSLIASYTLKTQGLVGEGRFERPTPCAQDRFRQPSKTAYLLLSSGRCRKPNETYWRLWILEAFASYEIIYNTKTL